MRIAVFVALLSATGCSFQPEPDVNRVTTRAGLSAASVPSVELGQDCSAQRQLCKTGHCLATVLAGRPAFVCTVLCATDDDCPLDFSCGEVAPRAYACIPSPTHNLRRVVVRSVKRAVPLELDAGPMVESATDGGP